MSTFLSVQFVPPSIAQAIKEPTLLGSPVGTMREPEPVTGGGDGEQVLGFPVQTMRDPEPTGGFLGDPVLGNPGPSPAPLPVATPPPATGGGGGGGGGGFGGGFGGTVIGVVPDDRIIRDTALPVPVDTSPGPGIMPLVLGALAALLFAS